MLNNPYWSNLEVIGIPDEFVAPPLEATILDYIPGGVAISIFGCSIMGYMMASCLDTHAPRDRQNIYLAISLAGMGTIIGMNAGLIAISTAVYQDALLNEIIDFDSFKEATEISSGIVIFGGLIAVILACAATVTAGIIVTNH